MGINIDYEKINSNLRTTSKSRADSFMNFVKYGNKTPEKDTFTKSSSTKNKKEKLSDWEKIKKFCSINKSKILTGLGITSISIATLKISKSIKNFFTKIVKK